MQIILVSPKKGGDWIKFFQMCFSAEQFYCMTHWKENCPIKMKLGNSELIVKQIAFFTVGLLRDIYLYVTMLCGFSKKCFPNTQLMGGFCIHIGKYRSVRAVSFLLFWLQTLVLIFNSNIFFSARRNFSLRNSRNWRKEN